MLEIRYVVCTCAPVNTYRSRFRPVSVVSLVKRATLVGRYDSPSIVNRTSGYQPEIYIRSLSLSLSLSLSSSLLSVSVSLSLPSLSPPTPLRSFVFSWFVRLD